MPVIGGRNELLSLAAGAGQYAQTPTGQPAVSRPARWSIRGSGAAPAAAEMAWRRAPRRKPQFSWVVVSSRSCPPPSLRNPDGRCCVSRQSGETVSLLSACYLRIPDRPMRVLAGLPNRARDSDETRRDATFHPGMTLQCPYFHELAAKPVCENLRRPKGIKRYHAGFGPQR